MTVHSILIRPLDKSHNSCLGGCLNYTIPQCARSNPQAHFLFRRVRLGQGLWMPATPVNGHPKAERAVRSESERKAYAMSLLVIILILIVLFGGVGYYGHGAGWGPYGWSPVGLLVIILIVLLLTGRLS